LCRRGLFKWKVGEWVGWAEEILGELTFEGALVCQVGRLGGCCGGRDHGGGAVDAVDVA
jgi:hypothetical protein